MNQNKANFYSRHDKQWIDACKFSASLEKTLLSAVLIKRENTSDKNKNRVRGRNSIVFNNLTFQMFSLILAKGRGAGKLHSIHLRTHIALLFGTPLTSHVFLVWLTHIHVQYFTSCLSQSNMYKIGEKSHCIGACSMHVHVVG